MNKYHAKKATRGKLTFDSEAEARRFDELMLLRRAGKIRNLKLQVRYCLQEGFKDLDGNKDSGIFYVADFVYERCTTPDFSGQVYWLLVVEDVKGMRTKDYAMKAKLFRNRYGFAIAEIAAR